jgi:hypothetical protein
MKKLYFAILCCATFNSYAGEIACSGKITLVMADHKSCTDSNNVKQLAFRLEGSPVWICNNSDAASSLVLKAKFENKSVSVYMNDEKNATCESHAQYIKPSYTFIL